MLDINAPRNEILHAFPNQCVYYHADATDEDEVRKAISKHAPYNDDGERGVVVMTSSISAFD